MPKSHNQQNINQWSFIMTIKGRFQELIIVLLLLVVFTTNAADTTTAEDNNSISSSVNNEWKRYHTRSEGDASHPTGRKLMGKKRPPTKRPNKKPTGPPSKLVRSHGVICRLRSLHCWFSFHHHHSCYWIPQTRKCTLLKPTASPTTTNDAGGDAQLQDWNSNKAKWDAFILTGGNGYEMEYQEDAQRLEWSLPYLVTVDKYDTVFSVIYMDGTTPVPVTDVTIIDHLRTVDEIFKLIKDSWSTAASVDVTYDADKGYPSDCDIDQIPGAAGDEIRIKINGVIPR